VVCFEDIVGESEWFCKVVQYLLLVDWVVDQAAESVEERGGQIQGP